MAQRLTCLGISVWEESLEYLPSIYTMFTSVCRSRQTPPFYKTGEFDFILFYIIVIVIIMKEHKSFTD